MSGIDRLLSPPITPPSISMVESTSLAVIENVATVGKKRFAQKEGEINLNPPLKVSRGEVERPTPDVLNKELKSLSKKGGVEQIALRLLALRQQVGEDKYLEWLDKIEIPRLEEVCKHLMEITYYFEGMSIHETKCQLYYLSRTEDPPNLERLRWLISNLLRQNDVFAFESMIQFQVNWVEEWHLLCEQALRQCTFAQLLTMFGPTYYDCLTTRLKENMLRRLMVEHASLPQQTDWIDGFEHITKFVLCSRRGVLEEGEVRVFQTWLAALPPDTSNLLWRFSHLIKFPDFPLFWRELKPFFNELSQKNCRFLLQVFLEWPELDLGISPSQLKNERSSLALHSLPTRVLLAHYLPRLVSSPHIPEELILGTLKINYQEWLISLYFTQKKYLLQMNILLPILLQRVAELDFIDQIAAYRLGLRIIAGLYAQKVVPEKMEDWFRLLLSKSFQLLCNPRNPQKQLCFKWLIDLGKIAQIAPELFRNEKTDWTSHLVSACTAANTLDRKFALLVSVGAIANAAPQFFRQLDIYWIDLLTLTRIPFPPRAAQQVFQAVESLSRAYHKDLPVAIEGGLYRLTQRRHHP